MDRVNRSRTSFIKPLTEWKLCDRLRTYSRSDLALSPLIIKFI